MVRVTSVVPSLSKRKGKLVFSQNKLLLKYETGEDVEKLEPSYTAGGHVK